jgi:hypothetical protein
VWSAGTPEPTATVLLGRLGCRAQYARSTEELADANRQGGGKGETSLQWSNPEKVCGCVEQTVKQKVPDAKDDTPVPVREWRQAISHCMAISLKEGLSANCPSWIDSHSTPEMRDSLSPAQKAQGCGCINGYLKGRTDLQFERLLHPSDGAPGEDPTLTPSDPRSLEELVSRCMDNGKL